MRGEEVGENIASNEAADLLGREELESKKVTSSSLRVDTTDSDGSGRADNPGDDAAESQGKVKAGTSEGNSASKHAAELLGHEELDSKGPGDEVAESQGQVETGTLERLNWASTCFVVAEGWPSWSFALQALGVAELRTYVASDDRFKIDLLATSLSSSMHEYSQFEHDICSEEAAPHLFVQGSATFVELVRNKLGDLESALGSFTCVVPQREAVLSGKTPFHQAHLSHKALGGVTTGQWRVFSSVPVRVPRSEVRRTLRHLVSTTESGTPDIPWNFRTLNISDRVAPGVDRQAIHAPSVFEPRGQCVRRMITCKEWMNIYDLGLQAQQDLTSVSTKQGLAPTRAFVKAAPLKVLIAVGRSIGASLRHLAVGAAIADTSPSPNGAPNSPSRSPTPAPSSPPPSSGSIPDDGEETAPQNIEQSIAAKHDDAVADAAMWDKWSVDSYIPSSSRCAPLVCVAGTYSPAHTRLFDNLRALCLRRVRQNAWRGFRRYLRAEHGTDTVPYTLRYTQQMGRARRNRAKRKRKRHAKVSAAPEAEVSSTPSGSNSPLLDSREEGLRNIYGSESKPLTRQLQVAAWTTNQLRCKVRKEGKSKSRKSRRKEVGKRSPEKSLAKDLEVGRDCLRRLANCSWWNWDEGSALFFWRWPKAHRKSIRDGTPIFHKREKFPAFFKKQQWPKDETMRTKMKEKLNKVRQRGYVIPGDVRSMTGYFAVPKGEHDIRMVYDATACGLNEALWSPNFFLPTIDSILRNADGSTWFGDIDLGDMFLNYFLDEAIRPWAGVDVRVIEGAQGNERWERCLMGLRSSPFICTQTFAWGEALIWGDRKALDNPLRWDKVILNLPGSKDYNPARPWVYKWDEVNNTLSSFFGVYIDDIRTGGSSEKACRRSSRRVASRVNYLGQQDAPRKRRPPAKRPGAWAGANCFSNEKGLFVTCSRKKWDKAKEIVGRWKNHCAASSQVNTDTVDRAQLEKDTGFLVHLSRTFPAMFPYLKSFYHTLNSWRSGRSTAGWKLSSNEWKEAFELDISMKAYEVDAHKKAYARAHDKEAPSKVKTVDGFGDDVRALSQLLSSEEPTERLVRGTNSHQVKFGFGDASGGGFGSSWTSSEGDTKYRFGTWGDDMDSSSSNLRELKNLVETLELMGQNDELNGVEMYLFTDNSTAEYAFFKGSSSSRLLFELVLKLRKLEMAKKCSISIFHVAGTRMIAQGSDGLSRGNMTEGVMTGMGMQSFIPTHLSATDRSPDVDTWIRSWAGESVEFLTPEGWFVRGHGLAEDEFEVIEGGQQGAADQGEGFKWPKIKPGKFVWTPPPAAAQAAVEELRKARHQDLRSTHVVVVPRLMLPLWRKQLHKAADLVVEVPVGHSVWKKEMHEPLTLAFCFPFIEHRPWQLRRSPLLLDLGKRLREVWAENPDAEGPILRELWSLPERLSGMSASMASKVLSCKHQARVPNSQTRKRRRGSMDEGKRRAKVPIG